MKFDFLKKLFKPKRRDVMASAAAESEFEICIMCSKPTKILKSVPIDRRKGFIHGCGQLCAECTRAMELDTHDRDYHASNREMSVLLQACAEDEQ